MAKNKEFKFKPMSKTNARRTVLYGILAVLSLALMRSILFFLIFAAIAVANGFLTKKSKENEAKYAEKVKELEEKFGDEMSEKDRKRLRKYCDDSEAEDESDAHIKTMLDKFDAEDAMYESYVDYEDDDYDEGDEDEE